MKMKPQNLQMIPIQHGWAFPLSCKGTHQQLWICCWIQDCWPVWWIHLCTGLWCFHLNSPPVLFQAWSNSLSELVFFSPLLLDSRVHQNEVPGNDLLSIFSIPAGFHFLRVSLSHLGNVDHQFLVHFSHLFLLNDVHIIWELFLLRTLWNKNKNKWQKCEEIMVPGNW